MLPNSAKLDAIFNEAKNLQFPLPIREGEPCLIQIVQGLHVEDPLFITRNLINLQQCVLLCLKVTLCLSGNFLDISDSQNICLLHSSNAYAFNQAIAPNSKSFEFNCRQKPYTRTPFVHLMPLPTSCGVAMSRTQVDNDLFLLQDRNKRIVGGFESEFYSQPWHGWVVEQGRHVCGATLIARHPNDKSTIWAISAAHCFVELKRNRKVPPTLQDYRFIFGIQDVRVFTPHIITRRALRILWPNKFGDKPETYDVALIEFTEAVTFSMYILPVCLPHSGPNYEDFLNSSICHVCGYGFTKDRFPFTLNQQSHRPDRMNCIKSEAKIRYNSDLIIRETSNKMDYKGFSLADSGGGYVCKGNEDTLSLLIGVINGVTINQFRYGRKLYYYYSYSAFLPNYINWVYKKIDNIADDEGVTCTTCWL